MFGLQWDPFKFTWGDAAAWVQAVGSIIAIAVAIWISHRDKMVLEAERTKERMDKLGFVYRYVGRCYDAMTEIYEKVGALLAEGEFKGSPRSVMKSITALEHLRDLATHIDIYSVPPDFAVSVVVELRQAINETVEWAHSAIRSAPYAHSDGRPSIERALKEIKARIITPEVILQFLEDHYKPGDQVPARASAPRA